MANRRNTYKRTLPASIATGTVVGITSCLILCGVAAFLMLNGTVKEERGAVAAFITLFLSGMIGCAVAGKAAGEQIATVCGITAAVYTVVLLGITVFFFGADFVGVIGKIVSVFLGCVVACMLSLRKGKKRGSR